jgi:starch-binding outer membrane protein, SusD/RagB family
MKKILIVFLAVVGLASCSKDFLERAPLDQLSSKTFWTSEKEVQAALNGLYVGWEWGDNVVYMDCASDNAYNPFPWEGFQVMGNGTLSAADPGWSRWNFSTIRKCNYFLANVNNAPIDASIIAQSSAQARFIRAYQYFILEQLYGDVPLITKELLIDEANTISRTPKAEVVKFILDELTAIAPDLPVSYENSEDQGRITRGAALALKSRIQLYEGKYADCITTVGEINNLGVYDLFPSYTDLFRIQNEYNQEVILDVEYKENDYSNWVLGVMIPASEGGWSSILPLQSLVDDYEMADGKTIAEAGGGYDPLKPYANRDPRFYTTIWYPGATLYSGGLFNPLDEQTADYFDIYGGARTGYNFRKYIWDVTDFADVWNSGMNMILIRYAEVLLSFAEAKIELGQIDEEMYSALDRIRTRAGMPAVDRNKYNNQNSLRTLVRRERRIELAEEGLRWYDVQRWKIGEQTMFGDALGSLNKAELSGDELVFTADASPIVVETRDFKSFNYLWPIPQKEIDINQNLIQNPGY